MKSKFCKIVTFIILSSILLTGCKKSKMDVPFSDIAFGTSYTDIAAIEGEEISSYPSLYNGTTHVYEKDYHGKNGTIKYMTGKNEELMNIAWAYTSEDSNDINTLYNQLLEELRKTYGDSENSDGVNNFVEIWKLDDGHIILSAVDTSEIKALQLAFLSQAAVEYKAEDVKTDDQ